MFKPANVAKSLLEGNREHLLSQARSELMKQEHKLESLNNCIDELQQQAYSQRLDLENAHHGYVESRREQGRLQEEFVMKEKVLRETQIRSMHEMGEMKRAQELRVDEFSVQKLRESHETSQRLTSQVQRITGKDGLFECIWRNPRSRVELWWKMFRRSQSTSKDSKSAINAELRQTLAT